MRFSVVRDDVLAGASETVGVEDPVTSELVEFSNGSLDIISSNVSQAHEATVTSRPDAR